MGNQKDAARLRRPAGADASATISDGCALFDRDLRCVWMDRHARALLGVRADAPIEASVRGPALVAPGGALEAIRPLVEEAAAAQVARRVEIDDATSGRRLEVRLHPTPDGLLAVIGDAGQRRDGDPLRARESLYQLLVERASDVVTLTAATGDPVYANPALGRLLGAVPGPWAEGVHPEDVPTVRAGWKRMLAGEETRVTYRHADARGAWRSLEARGSLVSHRGAPHVLAITRDVTERARTSEPGAEGGRRFPLLIEHAFDLVSVVSAAGAVVYASPSHGRVLGYTEPELAAMDPRALIHPDDADYVTSLWKTALVRGAAGPSRPVRVRAKGGAWRRVEALVRDLRREPEVGGFVVNARDVTETSVVEEQLAQSQKMEAIGRLAGGVAHDFNNLLTVITGCTAMLLAEVDPADPIRRDLGEVKAAADRAAGLTRQILAFSRRQIASPQVVDLRQVVGEMTPMLERLIGEDVEFTVGGDDAPAYAVADRAQVEQLVMNLVVNARDAMPSGGRLAIEIDTATLTAEDRARRPYVLPGHYARVRVRDTGVGMDERTLSRMFDPFFTTKDPEKGTGLGLATVYGIVKQSGGYVWAESVLGAGTTFSIHLPLAAAAYDAAAPGPAEAPAPAVRGGATVLLAEDESAVRAIAERVLRKHGYTVLSVRNGVEALATARWHDGPIDLLISDLVMPAMSGRELADRLAGIRGDVPVLFMTGYSVEAMADRGELDPGARLLHKPFTPNELASAVDELLRARTEAPAPRARGAAGGDR